MFGSVADDLLRKSGVIDIYVLSGDFGDTEPPVVPLQQPTSDLRSYAITLAIIGLCTAVAIGIDRLNIGEANLIMVYLLGVMAAALVSGRGPSVLASVLSVLAFNFLFVEPRLTFVFTDSRYLITFSVMLFVGLVVSTLMVRFRHQATVARQRERRTAALYALSREFASTRGLENLLHVAVRHLHEVFDSQVVILVPSVDGKLEPWGGR
ncbi:DUF4118 domain-containing protein [Candidatus Gracilibacteria bacterium]|nr:DUF4118 domain-containing protein [Candidatus Gracilibacteria bacterium]